MIEKNRAIVPQKLYVMSRWDWWYKIGVSIDPESRLRWVQTWSNVVLKLEKIYDYDNAFLLEQFLLSRFLDRIGEWVYIGDNWVEKIDDILNKYSI